MDRSQWAFGSAAAIAWVYWSWVYQGGSLGVISYVVAPSAIIALVYLLFVRVMLLELLPWLLQWLYKSDQNARKRLREPKLLLPFITSFMFLVLLLWQLYQLVRGIGNLTYAWITTGERSFDVRAVYGELIDWFLKNFTFDLNEIIQNTLSLYGLKALVDDIQSAQREALGTEWRQDKGFSDQVSISLNIIAGADNQFGMRTIKDVPLSELFPKEYACSLVKEASQLADDPSKAGSRVCFQGEMNVHPFLKVEPERSAFGKQGPTEADTFHRQLTDQLKNFLSSCFGTGSIVEDLAPRVKRTEQYVFALTHEKWNRLGKASVESGEVAQRAGVNNEKFRVYLIRKTTLHDLRRLHDHGLIKYDQAGPYGKHRVKMLLLLRQLYFFGNDAEDERTEPRMKVIEAQGRRLLSTSHSDDWCEIEFVSGNYDDRVRKSDVRSVPSPRRRLAAFQPDSIVKLKRTFVEHERLLASDMFITTHVAPDANTVAEAVNARMSGEHCVSAPAQLLYRVSTSSEGAQLLRSDSTASTAATAPALGARSPQPPLIEASRAAPKRSASDAGHGANRRSSRRLG